jgi:drug/metabolite transporter (DMT)-like permease
MPTMTHAPRRRESTRGIILLCLGIAIFALQDVILKWLAGDYPLSQVMLTRSVTAVPIMLVFVHLDGGLRTLFTPGTRAMIGRGLIMFVAYFAYYIALPALPLATTVALYFSAPLFITILSVVLLKETVGPRRWIALALGFFGVALMLQPDGTGFEWAALLVLLSGFAYALSMIAARVLGGQETGAALAFWGNAVFLVLSLVISAALGSGTYEGASDHASVAFLLRGWVTPTAFDLSLMMATGVVAALGLTLLTQAYRIAEASVVTPFEYTAMVWSVIYGWIIWQDWPRVLDWIGIAIIIGSGLYILWRDGTRAQD